MKTIILTLLMTMFASAQNLSQDRQFAIQGPMKILNDESPQFHRHFRENVDFITSVSAYRNFVMRPAISEDLRSLVRIIENSESEKMSGLRSPADAPDSLLEAISGKSSGAAKPFVQVVLNRETNEIIGFAKGELVQTPEADQFSAKVQYYTSPAAWSEGQAKEVLRGLIKKMQADTKIGSLQMIVSENDGNTKEMLKELNFEQGKNIHPSRFLSLEALNASEAKSFVRYAHNLGHGIELNLAVNLSDNKVYSFNRMPASDE